MEECFKQQEAQADTGEEQERDDFKWPTEITPLITCRNMLISFGATSESLSDTHTTTRTEEMAQRRGVVLLDAMV